MPQLEKPVLSNTLAGTVLLLLPSNPLRSPIRSLSGLGAGTTNPRLYYFDQNVGWVEHSAGL
ncbi:hypothetical protein QFZ34_003199 [Phyllobacterium ifriqiyense]|uniref:Uncharacterized protein n=1 Tax=Phyllobacterium ifriqiyense TaxID=314238 RepID=A0ABU0SB96_9HYPH|nr:hypothetical protein [Phyllobacterium ifriqiyense]